MFKSFIWFYIILAGGFFINPVFAEDSLNSNLENWVGTWQLNKGDYVENWDFEWTEEKTHLNFTFSSFEAGEPRFTANGFIFFDLNTAQFHFYMMMSNGALHANTGKLGDDGVYRLLSKTYGGPGFPDHEMIVTFNQGDMFFDYVYENEDGPPKISKNVLVRQK